MEEEAEADTKEDKEHMQTSPAWPACARGMRSRVVAARREVTGSTSQGSVWRATACCTPTTSPMNYCTTRRCFRMSQTLFHGIVEALQVYDPYFKCKKDCTGMVGFSSLQKCMVAMRLLTYGALGDTADDYLHMAESTARDCLYRFCKAVVVVFRPTYLISPNAQDIARILAIYEARGFPGMLGSIDCMH
ncbi:hypothetical protein QYE76_070326 [Lolium multiflorum]|uniref:Nuclease HARBI1 n=1 Tax=Lolium multiflorum TaxID=4521 RepID=A0AAD8SI00_LOLMU|nr:hypothetical protein QYE76_070326 [Lolium multiflorum]